MLRDKSKSTLISFSGYYGMNNFGDDMFGLVSAWGAEKYWPDVIPTVIAPYRKGFDFNLSVPRWFNPSWYISSQAGGKVSRLLFSLRDAARADIFVLGGGSVLSDVEGVRRILDKFSRFGQFKFAGMGVSIGPFRNKESERQVRDFLKKFQYLSVRDKISYALLQEWDLPCPIVFGGDLAGLMPLIAKRRKNTAQPSTPTIGIALCNYESYVGGDLLCEKRRNLAVLEGLLHSAKKHNAQVEIFSLNNHPLLGDDDFSQLVSQRLKSEKIMHRIHRNIDNDVFAIWDRISECNAFFSIRLHGAIAAYLNNVPFCLIEYHKKCSDFLDDIGQDQCIRLDGRVTSSAAVSNVLDTLLSQTPSPVFSPTEYTALSQVNFTAAPWSNNL